MRYATQCLCYILDLLCRVCYASLTRIRRRDLDFVAGINTPNEGSKAGLEMCDMINFCFTLVLLVKSTMLA